MEGGDRVARPRAVSAKEILSPPHGEQAMSAKKAQGIWPSKPPRPLVEKTLFSSGGYKTGKKCI